ncbi:MAG: class I SAM-dependent methyltransferase [Actinomycetota bacterium]|nr:class I SAM-dependent methyltransferase [Actinomycetota bacterium]
MDNAKDSFAVNRSNWDERAPVHAASLRYSVERFRTDPNYLSHVVRFDIPRIGDVTGLRGIHLQCHIGTDTISMARRGARMTGLDFSPASIREARRIAAETGTEVDFVVSSVYSALDVFPTGGFDLVFTGVGALCWLPDIRRWAEVVVGLLRPGGRLFLREGHPMMWAMDEQLTDRVEAAFPYFETAEPIVLDDPGTYVETDAEFTHSITHTWNHGIGEVVTALLERGMVLTHLEEHETVPWEALPGQMEEIEVEEIEVNEWRLTDRPNRLACSYTLQAVKIGDPAVERG